MIEGKLVNLRARETGDLDRMYRWINDGEVTRFLEMRYPISLAAEEAWIKSQVSTPASYADVRFAIETKDGVHIGGINFNEVSPEDRRARLGITIGETAYWSRGYGTDAMLTFVRFGFEEMNLHRIELTVHERNERARACYRKCGFAEEARMRQSRYVRGEYVDVMVMGILREEWEARQ